MAEQIEILVVDDDKEIANLVEIYLSSTGYKIHKAYNAVDGLALLQKYDIKLAIIDVMMPQIDGIEMCRRIRTCRNIPIIILSAKSADVDKILGLSVGADDYMIKPFNPMELLARVKSQLRRYLELNPGVVPATGWEDRRTATRPVPPVRMSGTRRRAGKMTERGPGQKRFRSGMSSSWTLAIISSCSQSPRIKGRGRTVERCLAR